ncbi:hypothetical protein DFJ58DRAFT_914242 [Suillus subalutaceus]|uniref:uncharacterized protein n=1 Tax=Suillus subalutaceus TaxID=48586 RepID=UPI001B871188|nr:uncharacterized protein DFJ58DRAFT_914242 [Suillus subalutaceus]KAG1853144.1 hypothetical protein DFJ58DRAFT_914242 [Suillus subalutaceus]
MDTFYRLISFPWTSALRHRTLSYFLLHPLRFCDLNESCFIALYRRYSTLHGMGYGYTTLVGVYTLPLVTQYLERTLPRAQFGTYSSALEAVIVSVHIMPLAGSPWCYHMSHKMVDPFDWVKDSLSYESFGSTLPRNHYMPFRAFIVEAEISPVGKHSELLLRWGNSRGRNTLLVVLDCSLLESGGHMDVIKTSQLLPPHVVLRSARIHTSLPKFTYSFRKRTQIGAREAAHGEDFICGTVKTQLTIKLRTQQRNINLLMPINKLSPLRRKQAPP